MRIDVTATRRSAYLYHLPYDTWMLYYSVEICGRRKDLLIAADKNLSEREARERCDSMAIKALEFELARLCN